MSDNKWMFKFYAYTIYYVGRLLGYNLTTPHDYLQYELKKIDDGVYEALLTDISTAQSQQQEDVVLPSEFALATNLFKYSSIRNFALVLIMSLFR